MAQKKNVVEQRRNQSLAGNEGGGGEIKKTQKTKAVSKKRSNQRGEGSFTGSKSQAQKMKKTDAF